jgi:predicted AAA+ superfamily ATPase
MDIYPFSFSEYLDFQQKARNKTSYLEYINFSGIPELYNLPSRNLQQSFISSLKDTIILKDLVKRYAIKEVDLLEKIFAFLSSNVGNLFSINAIARKLKSEAINISTTTLSNYLRYLQNILVFYGADRYDLKGKKILE